MKKIIYITGILFLASFSLSWANPKSFGNTGNSGNIQVRDSIIINFGNNSKILIYVKDKSDLDKIRSYDINAMLRDISISIDSAGKNTSYLKIEDESGEKYLSDTTIVIREGRSDREADESSSTLAKLKLANYRLEVNADDFEELEEEIDEFGRDGLEIRERTYEELPERTIHTFNIELGVNNYLEDGKFPDGSTDYTIKPFGSWYVSLNSVHKTAIGGPLFIEWGGNLSWYNFKMENPDVAIIKGENEILFEDRSPAISGKKSKLTASYINVSLVPVFDFSHGRRKVKSLQSGSFKISKYKKQGLRIGFGGYAGYRLGSHTKWIFRENGDRDKDKNRGNFHLNNFRYGIRGQFGFKSIDLFINYDLNELFQENKGPALNAISFGFTL
ncbi:hypothetical protein QQ008_07030 [Fulvivirgaceae bacterium BMA10]|uniref:Outer membrane protein beta-barrel domain-containing protein n=1 Tax=Splendidivirga corallicola TaxID=3051826 RepID=A0ABT8KK66_9BACT|nr:hypothetical protein [Fulvivirgaceae bacterium BMA10]